ncbi:MAG: DUF3604 domain-containing protein [Halioglobus sp.]
MIRGKTVLKILLAIALVLALLIGLATMWLRYEFERVSQEHSERFDWSSVAVTSLEDPAPSASPCAAQYPGKKAWFGALHVHTAASYDSTSFGSLVSSTDAYRFARGETLSLGLRGDPATYVAPEVSISTPLDFMAVTDHAENLGEVHLCHNPRNIAYDALPCKLYRGDIRLPVEERLQPIMRLASLAIFGEDRSVRICGEDGARCRQQAASAWRSNQQSVEAAHDYSSDCSFTAFHGYEYTLAVESSNLHRNVIFASSVVPQDAMSAKDARQPEQLWEWLDTVCISGSPACDAIAIPHNSNWSSGRMWFPYSNLDLPLEELQRQAALRAKVEPLAEIFQVKGDSECRNGIDSVLGAPDEFCDFEKLRRPTEATDDCSEAMGSGGMLLSGCISRFSYVRYALTAGLLDNEKIGVNPFKLGIIAATDTHNGTPAAGLEKGNKGSHGSDRDVKNRLLGEVNVPGNIAKGSPVRYNPGGVAGLYAEENSRAALFEAMRSRETFGTSGPRISPRFFAGWSLAEDICEHKDYPASAYDSAVPMGGDLPPGPQGWRVSPVFVTSANRDPREGGNLLQRIQIIKGWIDEQGRTQQAVYDVAGDPNNGASVDPASCAVSGPGFAQLCASWRDPDFNPAVPAVYYARVLENPSCRWSAHDCLSLPESERPASCSDPELPWQIQERAWTSPIWYQPAF